MPLPFLTVDELWLGELKTGGLTFGMSLWVKAVLEVVGCVLIIGSRPLAVEDVEVIRLMSLYRGARFMPQYNHNLRH